MKAHDDLWHVAFSVAYRILGLPWQAEDVAQSTMEKWITLPTETASSPVAYVAKMAANYALNTIRSEIRLREKHKNFGLPMPVAEDYQKPVDARIDLSYAVTTILLRLPATMRAVYILRTAFEMSFAEIGSALGRTPAACRQAYSRSNRAMLAAGQTANAKSANREQLEMLIALIQLGDPDRLAQYMARDIAFENDGGTTGPAFGSLIDGRDRIAKFLSVSSVLLGQNLKASFHHSSSGDFFCLHENGELKLFAFAQFALNKCTRLFAVSDHAKLSKFASFTSNPSG